MNIDLKKIIQQFPAAAASRQTLQGLMRDLYPMEKRDINVLLYLFDAGIPAELNKLQTLDNVQLHRLSKKVEEECGFAESVAADGVKTWAEALGIPVNLSASASQTTGNSYSAPQPSAAAPKASKPEQPQKAESEQEIRARMEDRPQKTAASKPVGKSKKTGPLAAIAVAVVIGLFFGIRALSHKPAEAVKTTETTAAAEPAESGNSSIAANNDHNIAQTIDPADYDLSIKLKTMDETDAVGTRAEDSYNNYGLPAHLYEQENNGKKESFSYCGGILARSNRYETINGKECQLSTAEYYQYELYKIIIRTYNDQGMQTAAAFYDPDGCLQAYYLYEKDSQDVNLQTSFYKADGTLCSNTSFEYSADWSYISKRYENGTLVSESQYASDNTIRRVTGYSKNGAMDYVFEYNEDGTKKSYTSYGGDGVMDCVFMYDEHGSEILYEAYTDGKPTYKRECINEYDPSGNLKAVYEVKDGSKTISETYEYNSDGKLERENHYSSWDSAIYEYLEYTYDAAGNLISIVTRDENNQFENEHIEYHSNAGEYFRWDNYKNVNNRIELTVYSVCSLAGEWTMYNPDGTVYVQN